MLLQVSMVSSWNESEFYYFWTRSVAITSDERVSNLEGLACNRYIHQNVLTNKGQGYKADLVIECTGLRPNNNFTKKVFGKTDWRTILETHDICTSKQDMKLRFRRE